MNKTIRIKRTIDITLSVPMEETREEAEEWVDKNLIPDFTLENIDPNHIIKDIRLADDDNQDDFLVVEWPESQSLMEHEGFEENCTLLLSDGFGSATYMVRKEWYSKLRDTELKKIA